jgi:homoserine kinase
MEDSDAVVRVFAPATIANLGAGFDVLGLALDQPGDVVIGRRVETPGVRLEVFKDHDLLPREVDLNTVSIAAQHVLRQLGVREGVRLRLLKGIPMAGGLGSSAGSAVAGAVAVNALFGEPLAREDLLEACVAAEGVVSGFHADNVAAGLLGGVIMVKDGGRSVSRLPVPTKLVCALASPDVDLPTAVARRALPSEYPLRDVVTQASNVAALVSALYENDVRRFAAAMVDVVAEPTRSRLIPGFDQAREATLRKGALAFIISGAGPSVCAMCDSARVAKRAAKAMAEAFRAAGVGCESLVARPSEQGARVMRPGDAPPRRRRRSFLAPPPPLDHYG